VAATEHSVTRERLFDQVADLYDDVRPDYPDDLYDVFERVSGGLEGRRVLTEALA
jgi:hypothetical protein